MLTVLALGIVKTTINHLFDELSDDDKAPLIGKTLRIHIGAILLHGLVMWCLTSALSLHHLLCLMTQMAH